MLGEINDANIAIDPACCSWGELRVGDIFVLAFEYLGREADEIHRLYVKVTASSLRRVGSSHTTRIRPTDLPDARFMKVVWVV